MLFTDANDFYEKTSIIPPLDRDEEISCANKMRDGDQAARERLIRGYLPFVAATVRRLDARYQTLQLIMRCCVTLEKAVDRFDFLQESEPFIHHLSWGMRNTVTSYIADNR